MMVHMTQHAALHPVQIVLDSVDDFSSHTADDGMLDVSICGADGETTYHHISQATIFTHTGVLLHQFAPDPKAKKPHAELDDFDKAGKPDLRTV